MIDVHQIHEYTNAYMLFEALWYCSSILDGRGNDTRTFTIRLSRRLVSHVAGTFLSLLFIWLFNLPLKELQIDGVSVPLIL